MFVARKYGAVKPAILLATVCLALSGPVQGEESSPAAVSVPAGTLRNLDFLPRLQTSRPPSRPRKFLRRRNLKVLADRDEKYVQLLLVCVGFVSMFIVILALRSMPPVKKTT